MSVDEAIKKLGVGLLRELNAVCFFCDASSDGKSALISSAHRSYWQPGGPSRPLADLGCVRLIKRTHCAGPDGHFPALRMEQFGRQVLRRARAMMIDLEPREEAGD